MGERGGGGGLCLIKNSWVPNFHRKKLIDMKDEEKKLSDTAVFNGKI
jgi:hypothetical protein